VQSYKDLVSFSPFFTRFNRFPTSENRCFFVLFARRWHTKPLKISGINPFSRETPPKATFLNKRPPDIYYFSTFAPKKNNRLR